VNQPRPVTGRNQLPKMEASPKTINAPRQGLRLPALEGVCMKRVRRAASLVASYASLNILGRVVQMITAFMVVRALSKTDYAWYSLANNLVAALGMFTVTGIGTGLMPVAGEVAHDRVKLGSVMASAARFRTSLLLVGSLTGIPVFVHLLLHSDCSVFKTSVLVTAALASVLINIASQMMTTPLSLARRYSVPQWETIMNCTVRLLFIAALIGAGMADAITVMIITVLAPLPSVFGWMLPKARQYAAFEQPADPAATTRLKKHFIVGLPTSLTYLFEAQIATFIIGFMGNIDKVADLGAIGRVALILQVPLAIASGILLPRMSAEQDQRRLWKLWISSSLIAVVTGGAALLGGWLLRHQLLMLLGPAYAGLEHELVFYLGFQVFSFVITVISMPVQSKGWVRHSWIRPILVFGCQALSACFLDLSTVNGAIGLMCAGSVGNTLLNVFLLFNGWRGRAGV
jgi:O-antigen/teichoic acid export membrane protein